MKLLLSKITINEHLTGIKCIINLTFVILLGLPTLNLTVFTFSLGVSGVKIKALTILKTKLIFTIAPRTISALRPAYGICSKVCDHC